MNDRPLEKIDALPEEQRQKLAVWLLAGTTLDEAVDRVQKEFGVQIPRSTNSVIRHLHHLHHLHPCDFHPKTAQCSRV